MSEWSMFKDGMSEVEIDSALTRVPPDIARFLETVVRPQIPSKKIEAIKAVREESGLGLRSAKYVVDAMARGTIARYERFADPALLDAIERVEDALRVTIRIANGDDKSMCALRGIRQQVTELWTDLTDLPTGTQPT